MMGKYYSGIEFQYLELLPILYLGGEYIYRLSMSKRDFEPKQKQDADIIETRSHQCTRGEGLLGLVCNMIYNMAQILTKINKKFKLKR